MIRGRFTIESLNDLRAREWGIKYRYVLGHKLGYYFVDLAHRIPPQAVLPPPFSFCRILPNSTFEPWREIGYACPFYAFSNDWIARQSFYHFEEFMESKVTQKAMPIDLKNPNCILL
jgi:hypothetical protein